MCYPGLEGGVFFEKVNSDFGFKALTDSELSLKKRFEASSEKAREMMRKLEAHEMMRELEAHPQSKQDATRKGRAPRISLLTRVRKAYNKVREQKTLNSRVRKAYKKVREQATVDSRIRDLGEDGRQRAMSQSLLGAEQYSVVASIHEGGGRRECQSPLPVSK